MAKPRPVVQRGLPAAAEQVTVGPVEAGQNEDMEVEDMVVGESA
jgi:hypothetical protein